MKILTASNDRLTSAALAVLRITLGLIMFAHGVQKVLGVWGGHGLEGTVMGMNGGLGIPVFLVYCSAFTEFLGGALIALGLLTRFAAIAVFINMMVAVLLVHMPNGFFAPTGFEFPFTLAMAALTVAIAGPGKLSLDAKVFRVSGR